MLKILKQFIEKYFGSILLFYRHLKYRLLVVFILSSMVGVLDGFGLAMFLPMLEMVSGEGNASAEQMGNLTFIIRWLEFLGFDLTLSTILFTMLFFFSLKGLVKFIEQYQKVAYRQFFIRNIRVDNIRSLARFSYDNFVLADSGRIQNTMSGEVSRVGQGFNVYMVGLQQMILLLVYTGLAILANPQFAILVAIGGGVTNLFFSKLFRVTKRLSKTLTKSNHKFQGLIIQQVAQFKYLKATGLIRKYSDKLIKKVYDIEESQRKIGVLDAIMNGIREPLLVAVVVCVILIQVNLMGGSLGTIVLSILFFYRALTSVMQVQTSWNKYLELSGSFENIMEFSRELKKGKEELGENKFSCFLEGIKLENLNYNYGDKPVLQDINLHVKKHETVAFVGASGSGKTTLMNIICGLLKPQKGRFLIDGIDANELNINTYQKHIGYITQEPVIFNDSIYNNVTFWAEMTDKNVKRFWKAVEQASIKEFILEQEFQEETELGNNGINISGGQKQRLSIARELYKDIEILLLDEATSALDTETEKSIQQSIDNLKGKYTILIIAHRLSTVKNVDRIVLMSNGMVEEVASYPELLKINDGFRKMVELQEI